MPEGYRRAADAFRGASALIPSNCEYSIRLGDALVFLAQELKLNFEDFEPPVSEAALLAEAMQSDPGCSTFESAIHRQRALGLYNANYYPAFLALGRTLMGAERYDEAEAALVSLIKLDVTPPRPPQNATGWASSCHAKATPSKPSPNSMMSRGRGYFFGT